ncbi:putative PepSY-like beta-lactamase-inhibitor [Gillisia mitskevichiae]|uniref:Putative PepSY-like beta-lactamase-inhibitor n=1 Tax=Gillisia mitskevichiae TaxID=270921 RepID=A0A495PTJ4_9FLAO|nr:PepSY-like domain-containing protein [Gillisia mitskevichiae]RKS53075.1 putative PepSY-like beta-lactamase-inhibitor [Gillisia mitskevichiae]
MKRYLVLLSFLCVGIVSCQENKKADKENDDVPEAVQITFQNKYPGETDPDWEQDEHGYWESHFKIDGEKYRADFNADGSWVETENSIKNDELPEAIKSVIKEKYSDHEITEVEHVESAKHGVFYDVEFKQKGKNKDVMFREDGSIIN